MMISSVVIAIKTLPRDGSTLKRGIMRRPKTICLNQAAWVDNLHTRTMQQDPWKILIAPTNAYCQASARSRHIHLVVHLSRATQRCFPTGSSTLKVFSEDLLQLGTRSQTTSGHRRPGRSSVCYELEQKKASVSGHSA